MALADEYGLIDELYEMIELVNDLSSVFYGEEVQNWKAGKMYKTYIVPILEIKCIL